MQTSWVLGVDVGTNSTGLAAIRFEEDSPDSVLAMISVIHDGGMDPDQAKTGLSRKYSSGVARRVRRLYRQRRNRLRKLQTFLVQSHVCEPVTEDLDPWVVRTQLYHEFVTDDIHRRQLLYVAILHIARHRGWRNPWMSVSAIREMERPSQHYRDFRKSLEDAGSVFEQVPTIGELGSAGLLPTRSVGQKFHQEDLLWELEHILQTQRVDEKMADEIIARVFYQKRPSVPAERVGLDPLDRGMRAPVGSLEFQEFRLLDTIANLRIRSDKGKRPLNVEEREKVFDRLNNPLNNPEDELTWADVARDILGIDEGDLVRSEQSDAGDRTIKGAKAPRNVSLIAFEAFRKANRRKIDGIDRWWTDAVPQDRADFIAALAGGAVASILDEQDSSVHVLFDSLGEEELALLDSKLSLPPGRASYSRATLARLIARMKGSELDLRAALTEEFDVGPNWHPPLPSLNELTGQPTVDRNVAAVRQFVSAAELRWGTPKRVVIELAREGLKSPKTKSDISKEQAKRRQANDQIRDELRASHISRPTRTDIVRKTLLQLFEGKCLYCGSAIGWENSEIDHIVARAQGGVNSLSNLALVCGSCNLSKGKMPFAAWASSEQWTATAKRVREARFYW